MSSSSYLELLKLKQAKLLKVVDLFESGVRERSDFVSMLLCDSDKVFFNHSKNAALKLFFISDVKLECPNKKLSELRDSLVTAPDCGYKQRPPNLMSRHEMGEKRFKCRNCKFAASSKVLLKEHRVKRHWKSTECSKNVFVCEFGGCKFRTTFNSYAVEHRRRHLKIKPFNCQHQNCNLSFASKSDLLSHKIVHAKKKRFRCMQKSCNFATKHRSSLKKHHATHSSVRAFKCRHKNCSYAAKRKSNLRQHMLIHSEAKPYKCHFSGCGYAAKYKDSVRKHASRHHNAKFQFNSNVYIA